MHEAGAGRRRFGSAAEFASDVREVLTEHLAPARVSFRGSFAEGTHDEYSDVDLLAEVHSEMDGRFFSALEDHLTGLYGPALVRYDPDHMDRHDSQHVRFSFYELPVFWRVDLEIVSDKAAAEKWPSPFPGWAVGTSALMNVVWAIKYRRRGKDGTAQRYLAAACEKLGARGVPGTAPNVLEVLDLLEVRGDVDEALLAKTRQEVELQSAFGGTIT